MKQQAMLHLLAPQSSSQMMGYLLQTEDGYVIAIDGGTAADTAHFEEQLLALTGKRHIDLWLLTHAHFDHIDVFCTMLRTYGAALDVDRICYHFPTEAQVEENEPIWIETIRSFNSLIGAVSDRTQIVSDGDSFMLGNTKIDILHHPHPECTDEFLNNTSVVYRITTTGQRLLFPGDLATEEGNRVLEEYGSALRCDFIQMAHHGQNGVRRSFYEAAAPRACLWNTPQWLWDNDAGKGYNTHCWETVTVRAWTEEMGITHHFVAKDGDQHIPLPFPFSRT